MEENKPLISYRHNESFRIIPISYELIHEVEIIIRERLNEIAIQDGYIEIEIIDNDYSVKNYVICHCRVVKK